MFTTKNRDGDLGAAFNIVVTPAFDEIVVGYSEKQRKHKLIGGQIEESDAFTKSGVKRKVDEMVIAGATRELFRETGLVGDPGMLYEESGVPAMSDLLFETIFLPFQQPIRGGRCWRYFCFSMLKDRIALDRDYAEKEEMRGPEYWEVAKAIKQGLIGGFNPYHAIGICEWIKLFTEQEIAEVREFKRFANLSEQLYLSKIDPSQVANELTARIATGDA